MGDVTACAPSMIAFYVFSRYRLHALPALAVLAAAGAGWLVEQGRPGRWRRPAP